MSAIYGFYVNLDERGDFYADVRAGNGDTVFEIRAGDDGGIELIEDGFMRGKEDLAGLADYLKETGFIEPDAELLGMADFERRLEEEPESEDEAEPGF
ncbi:hypothetical protein ACEUZ9_000901 [Paracoccus litorisediminis]|uniref:hypothetical protein n=1 Tax=Paracoccus litorisediminis TaxID=2006130 RepID=UPI003733D6EE